MSQKRRIVLIHATRISIDPIETAFAALWPEVDVVSILEEGLAADRATERVSVNALNTRIVDLAHYAIRLAPDAILYTCSAFGEGIETAAMALDIPVLKPNEAMFDAALNTGGAVVMLYTFPPAAKGMELEFRAEAARLGSDAQIRSVFVVGALEALKSGDVARHNALVSECAARVTDADVILLAHFSMTPAAAAVRAVTKTPVLTSPEAAIDKLRRCLADIPERAVPC